MPCSGYHFRNKAMWRHVCILRITSREVSDSDYGALQHRLARCRKPILQPHNHPVELHIEVELRLTVSMQHQILAHVLLNKVRQLAKSDSGMHSKACLATEWFCTDQEEEMISYFKNMPAGHRAWCEKQTWQLGKQRGPVKLKAGQQPLSHQLSLCLPPHHLTSRQGLQAWQSALSL